MSFLFWAIYYPLLILLRIILFPVPFIRARFLFEKKNLQEAGAWSFKEKQIKADLCFEFSSEGEYQQVASLIDDALKAHKKIELVFFSPSVEKAVIELFNKYPEQIRYLRFPLVTFGPLHSFSNWVTSNELIMVRYDLFPEFLLWAKKDQNCLKMLWVSFKKERIQDRDVSWIKRQFLKEAKIIFYASEQDQKVGFSLGLQGENYDFRMEQIKRRIDHKENKFKNLLPQYPELKKMWDTYPKEKRLIIGNAWIQDLILLKNLPSDVFVLVVPHKLEAQILTAIFDELKSLGRNPVELTGDQFSESDTVVLNKKGVLCELYADFGRAYVGGGMGVSVHSILEPLVAGSDLISSGPVHHRSTEYDVAQSMGRMTEVKNAEDFNLWLSLTLPQGQGHDKMLDIFDRYLDYRKVVISC